MYLHKESLSHLEYFKHWPLKCRLCKEWAKGNSERLLHHGDNYNTFF